MKRPVLVFTDRFRNSAVANYTSAVIYEFFMVPMTLCVSRKSVFLYNQEHYTPCIV